MIPPCRLQVVLLHGQAFTSKTWEELGTMALLATHGYQALAMDLPGTTEVLWHSINTYLSDCNHFTIKLAFITVICIIIRFGTQIVTYLKLNFPKISTHSYKVLTK